MKQRSRPMHGGDYLLSYNMTKKTDGDDGEIQLHKMKPKEHYIEAQIQEGDTLQAISLRFYCSISELKRINLIHTDNEIYARRTIKVPISPYSVLTETMPTSQTPEPIPSTSSALLTTADEIAHHLLPNNTQNIVQSVQNKETKDDCEIDCNEVILNSTLAPSVVPYTNFDPDDVMSEDTQLLPSKPKETVETVVVKELTSHGADFEIKWYHLVGVIILLGFVIPLLYVRYVVNKYEHEHEHLDKPPLHGSG